MTYKGKEEQDAEELHQRWLDMNKPTGGALHMDEGPEMMDEEEFDENGNRIKK